MDHWDRCWMVHHGCAINRIEKLEAQLANELAREVSGRFNAESGRRGGLKGGKARAARLDPARRKEIARKAGKTRVQRLYERKKAGVDQR